MFSTLSHIAPILFGFVVGHVLRRSNVATERDSSFIFKLVFYVCIPALVFNSLSTVDITKHLLIFSLLAGLLYLAGFIAGRTAANRMSLDGLQKPVFMVAAMGVNSVFALPYLQHLFGAEGVARFVAFDAINTVLLYSWAYSIAVRANPAHVGEWVLVRRLSKSPPLYAVAAGLFVNALDLPMPDALMNTAAAFSAPTGFLVTVAIGIALNPKPADIGVAVRTISVRTGTALLVGFVIIGAFDLTGVDKTTVLLLCVAPVAFSSATFAALENLDVRFAAATLSISLVVGIALTTAVALVFA